MIELNIDRDSPEPISQQIKEQIIHFIEVGILKEGFKLPSSRSVAKDLNLNRSTVYKSYRDLWALGYIDSKPGSYSRIRKRSDIVRNISDKDSINWLDKINNKPVDSIPVKRSYRYDFSSISPDKSIIPVDNFRRCFNDVLKSSGKELLMYGEPGGYMPLREYISSIMGNHMVATTLEELIITDGAQNALELLCKIFKKDGWSVVVERPSYSEAISLFKYYGAKIYEVEIDENGIDTDKLTQIIRDKNPSFIYVMPNFHNPTGYTSSQRNREKLLEICEKSKTPIIEDGFCEDIRGEIYPIKSMDKGGIVIYIGTFSKTLFPGVRIGWINCRKECIRRLIDIQHMGSISGNLPIQAALNRFLRLGYYQQHISKINRIYKLRVETALKTLKDYFPKNMGLYSNPKAGITIWITLNKHNFTEDRVIKKLEEASIGVKPGKRYFIKDVNKTYLRLSITQTDIPQIKEGIELLCKVLKEV